MILFETKKWNSEKKSSFVDVICEDCYKERNIRLNDAAKCFNKTQKNLCRPCARLGENNPMWGQKRFDQIGDKNPMKRPEVFQKYMENHGFRGRHHTEENKEKASIRMSGENNYWWGKKHSEETKKKMSNNSAMKRPEVAAKLSGQNNPWWKPPEERRTPLIKAIRQSTKCSFWRRQIFKRDDRTCLMCRSKKEIHADHVIPLSFLVKKYNIKSLEDAFVCEELWDINNGKTLCFECHKKTDTYGIKAIKYGENK